MIILLDTNVIVSGILRPYSKAASILRLVATGVITLACDLRIFSEYRDVLNRPNFTFAKEDIDAFLDQVEKEGLLVSVMPLKFSSQTQKRSPS
jgi:predicted nucleic acid-binding protein